jgi:hypothetical protein
MFRSELQFPLFVPPFSHLEKKNLPLSVTSLIPSGSFIHFHFTQKGEGRWGGVHF